LNNYPFNLKSLKKIQHMPFNKYQVLFTCLRWSLVPPDFKECCTSDIHVINGEVLVHLKNIESPDSSISGEFSYAVILPLSQR
jgi:hypothetical protein